MSPLTTGPQAPETQSWTASWSSLPRIWVFLGYLFPRTTREREFRPAFEDLPPGLRYRPPGIRPHDHSAALSKPVVIVTKIAMNVRFGCWVAKLVADVILLRFHKRE